MTYDLQGYTCHAFEETEELGERFVFSRNSDGFVVGEIAGMVEYPGLFQLYANGEFLGTYAGIKPALHALAKAHGWKATPDEAVD